MIRHSAFPAFHNQAVLFFDWYSSRQELFEDTVEIPNGSSFISSNETGTTVFSNSSDVNASRQAILTIVNHFGPLVKVAIACNQCCLRFHRLPPSVKKVSPTLF